MTLCNMSIERSARGIDRSDETTFAYATAAFCPQRQKLGRRGCILAHIAGDPGAKFDRVIEIDAASLAPFVTWGTNPGMVAL